MEKVMKHSHTFSALVRKFPKKLQQQQQQNGEEVAALTVSATTSPSSLPSSQLGSFFFPARLRDDTWVELNHLCSPLLKGDGNCPPQPDEHHKREIETRIKLLRNVEDFWGFPGRKNFHQLVQLFEDGHYQRFAAAVVHLTPAINDQVYRQLRWKAFDVAQVWEEKDDASSLLQEEDGATHCRGYFEVLVVGVEQDSHGLAHSLSEARSTSDSFTYSALTVASLEDAICAILFNTTIQSVVVRSNFQIQSPNGHGQPSFHSSPYLNKYSSLGKDEHSLTQQEARTMLLAQIIKEIRPELDIFCFSDLPVERVALTHNNQFSRVFYNESNDAQELHLSILQGVQARFETPFFNALVNYSKNPMGVFHAMPISRGASLTHSHWIKDMFNFYGRNIFLAETSATCGGLDSLLEPHGTIKAAQELAAQTFGSDRSFWVTNGTSTANKIVVQGLVRPGDIVLVDRNCHKSHHLGLALVGASVVYLEAYPLRQYAMYGAVPLRTIKETLLKHKAAGTLAKVKMVLLTNCTFDGIVYNVQRVMEECLAIKPDLVFLWDEAWWGFAYFHYLLRLRTAMYGAQQLKLRYQSASYREEYDNWVKANDGDEAKMFDPAKRWLPDPSTVRIRVYATQSTHKTLTALRQGSMIHVRDQDFKRSAERPFTESFFTHTSTSPNYQILASLDVGRRQMALEGLELVQKHTEKALMMRKQLADNPDLNRWFHFLDVDELIPAEYRQESELKSYVHVTDTEESWLALRKAWLFDEFVLDPNRLTLHIGKTGIDGDTFKTNYLMDRFQIQVNKTSINSVLFMLTIGTTRSSIAYLLESLIKIGELIDASLEDRSPAEMKLHEKKKWELTQNMPPLPNFSHFHPKFRKSTITEEGVLRMPFFMAYEEDDCDYIPLRDRRLDDVSKCAIPLVSANFVIPYPPGFPILVPGQEVSQAIIDFFRHLDVKEVHGYVAELGLRIFKPHVVENAHTLDA